MLSNWAPILEFFSQYGQGPVYFILAFVIFNRIHKRQEKNVNKIHEQSLSQIRQSFSESLAQSNKALEVAYKQIDEQNKRISELSGKSDTKYKK